MRTPGSWLIALGFASLLLSGCKSLRSYLGGGSTDTVANPVPDTAEAPTQLDDQTFRVKCKPFRDGKHKNKPHIALHPPLGGSNNFRLVCGTGASENQVYLFECDHPPPWKVERDSWQFTGEDGEAVLVPQDGTEEEFEVELYCGPLPKKA